jgi:hypothetical protein
MANSRITDLLHAHRDLAAKLEKEVQKADPRGAPAIEARLKLREKHIERLTSRLQTMEASKTEAISSYDSTIATIKEDITILNKQLESEKNSLKETKVKLKAAGVKKK